MVVGHFYQGTRQSLNWVLLQTLSATTIQLLLLEVVVEAPHLLTKISANKLSDCRAHLQPLSATSTCIQLLLLEVLHCLSMKISVNKLLVSDCRAPLQPLPNIHCAGQN